MTRLIIPAAAALALLCGTAPAVAGIAERPASARASLSDCGYRVATEGVRLRTGPGTRYTALGQLHRDDTVYAVKSRHGWYRVRLAYDSGSRSGTRASSGLREGTTGWVVRRAVRAHVCTRID
ncbi:hypothetical protein ACE1SV_74570 [Streptomyces sp. E-15]